MGVNILEETAAFIFSVGDSVLKIEAAGSFEKLVPIYCLHDIASEKMVILIDILYSRNVIYQKRS
jgi:hypothetical protein